MLNFEPLLKWMCVSLRAAEEEISFPPTYRYERGSRDTYVWQKQKATGVRSLSYVRATSDKFFLFLCLVLIILLFRLSQMRTNVPSWCDRILWKSYPETHIVCNSYGEDHQKKKTFIISPHNAKWTEIKVVVYFCLFVFFARLYRWCCDQWSFPCICYIWGGRDLPVCLQKRYKFNFVSCLSLPLLPGLTLFGFSSSHNLFGVHYCYYSCYLSAPCSTSDI